ncbi:MAG: hypothetical protein JOZ54_04610 [Acidobacteria bacterium]|nr:hypothetical protein [Acidobacteriota bacterium]
MRNLALILLLTLAPTLLAECDRVVFRDGDVTTNGGKCGMNVDRIEALRVRYGRRFVWFERDGKTYISREAQLIDRLRKLYQPQADLGAQQAALGEQQAKLGVVQARLGEEQARIGQMQTRAGADQNALSAKQNELGARQNELGQQQNILGEKQNKMGERMNALAREADRKLPAILDEAIAKGWATRL